MKIADNNNIINENKGERTAATTTTTKQINMFFFLPYRMIAQNYREAVAENKIDSKALLVDVDLFSERYEFIKKSMVEMREIELLPNDRRESKSQIQRR